ncbi:MAG: hypothetical protein U1F67_12700 [Rubrivivax sp.]
MSERPIAFWGDFESNYRPRHAENLAAMGAASAVAQRSAAAGQPAAKRDPAGASTAAG